ncbi:MAG TPA: DUF3892 domain-containing protein [Polyangiaceae bacterium]|nr:DUF3892 domain-containing protein [Polyangiaceae bacterium]
MIYITDIHLVGGRGHEHIANVKWKNPTSGQTGENDRASMVKWVNEKVKWVNENLNEAKVTDGRNTVNVGVHPGTPAYLRTHADGKWSDNLLALPRY